MEKIFGGVNLLVGLIVGVFIIIAGVYMVIDRRTKGTLRSAEVPVSPVAPHSAVAPQALPERHYGTVSPGDLKLMREITSADAQALALAVSAALAIIGVLVAGLGPGSGGVWDIVSVALILGASVAGIAVYQVAKVRMRADEAVIVAWRDDYGPSTASARYAVDQVFYVRVPGPRDRLAIQQQVDRALWRRSDIPGPTARLIAAHLHVGPRSVLFRFAIDGGIALTTGCMTSWTALSGTGRRSSRGCRPWLATASPERTPTRCLAGFPSLQSQTWVTGRTTLRSRP